MMKFNFKIQQYQTDAVMSVADVFRGQPRQTEEPGMGNRRIALTDTELLDNIRKVQEKSGLPLSSSLAQGPGSCSLDIEMETGTGKTYVYMKTMYELNKRYGWSRFIVVVPSIAIREGVRKSFEITQEHFMEQYGSKLRFFIYNSRELNRLDGFSSDQGINVMIINMQAFNTSLKEGGRNKEAKIIYGKRDEFGSRRPIDVIRECRPVVILDEPQRMGGPATQAALENFDPLFCLNYSATHKKAHNLVFALDAVDAYEQKLVKKIEVKGLHISGLGGTGKYLYVEGIRLSSKHPPMVMLEFETSGRRSVRRESRLLGAGADLYELSGQMEQYRGMRIQEIDPQAGKVWFTDGEVLRCGEASGDVMEKDMRRLQIRETIRSHLEKEEALFEKGIKTLSLFFVDHVSKYRQYDEKGEERLGEYGKIFEEEYKALVMEYRPQNASYRKYLEGIQVHSTHNGYFSVDKKGRSVDSPMTRGTDLSDDVSAYDLILKDKERLLSFEEPTRFIFSHSALREGWDNPNVFQICTLKQGGSATMKHQEVGRGLRLCVNAEGVRMDAQYLGSGFVHDINRLTIIASESYESYAAGLQKQIRADLRERRMTSDGERSEGRIPERMFADAGRAMVSENELNENFEKAAFQELWEKIRRRYTYTVQVDSEEVIRRTIRRMDSRIQVSVVRYTVTETQQGDVFQGEDSGRENPFYKTQIRTGMIVPSERGETKYDVIGRIARGTGLTRRTSAKILSGIRPEKFAMLKENPEEFIRAAIRLIREVKAEVMAQNVVYRPTGAVYGPEIFTAQKKCPADRAFRAEKHIQDYVFVESAGKVEAMQRFAMELDRCEEVCAYAKLPRGYTIPTPAGDFTPEWAIAFDRGKSPHIGAVVMMTDPGEAKTCCAEKMFGCFHGEILFCDRNTYEERRGR